MRIFLDANILFSAAHSDGAVRRLLGMLRNRGHVLQADAYVVEEARRNLLVKRIAEAELLRVLRTVDVAGSAPPIEMSPDIESALPAKDRPVLLSAIRLGCAALVTGDRTHFGGLYGTTIRGVTIFSPRLLAERLLS